MGSVGRRGGVSGVGCCDFKNNNMSKDRILKEEHILEYQAAFNQFDHKNTGLVATKVLGDLLRQIGINPTKEELQDLTIQIDPNVSGFLKLPDLLDMMSRIVMERNYDAQIEDAFRCFDRKGTGMIPRSDAQMLFENLGESLKEEEIEGLLDEGDLEGDGSICYMDFCAIKNLM